MSLAKPSLSLLAAASFFRGFKLTFIKGLVDLPRHHKLERENQNLR
jgi:hypothetical protein